LIERSHILQDSSVPPKDGRRHPVIVQHRASDCHRQLALVGRLVRQRVSEKVAGDVIHRNPRNGTARGVPVQMALHLDDHDREVQLHHRRAQDSPKVPVGSKPPSACKKTIETTLHILRVDDQAHKATAETESLNRRPQLPPVHRLPTSGERAQNARPWRRQ